MTGKEMKWLVSPSAESSTGRFQEDKEDEGATSGQKWYRGMIHEAGLRRKN
jgi:hypothetical protein